MPLHRFCSNENDTRKFTGEWKYLSLKSKSLTIPSSLKEKKSIILEKEKEEEKKEEEKEQEEEEEEIPLEVIENEESDNEQNNIEEPNVDLENEIEDLAPKISKDDSSTDSTESITTETESEDENSPNLVLDKRVEADKIKLTLDNKIDQKNEEKEKEKVPKFIEPKMIDEKTEIKKKIKDEMVYWTVEKLRECCKNFGLIVTGKKGELILRLLGDERIFNNEK